MMTRILLLPVCLLLVIGSIAQQPWDLQKCVDYALANNISVRQADLQSRFSDLALKQGKAAQLPTLSFSGNAGYRFGLSENPTTGILENNKFFNVGLQMQSQVTLFNWFAIRNNIEANRLTLEADKEQTKKVQNDVALNVAVAYLQILLAHEQVNVAEIQVKQTTAQLESTRKQVDAGKLPELNAAQLESQLANDSSSLITAQASAQQFILQLKALLNVDAGAPFSVVTPPVEMIPVKPLAELEPETVYASALANLPQQKVNQLRIQSAERSVKVSRAGLLPTIAAFGGLGTSYVNLKRPITSVGPKSPTGATVTVGGTDYSVDAPRTVIIGEEVTPVGRQFRTNFGQNIGIGLSVPIFNGRQARTSWERSKLTLQNLQLTKEQGDMQLKQDIYKAYVDATAAIQKYHANQKAASTAQKAYDFAQKRYEQGLLSTYDLINSQNALLTAKTQQLYAQFDYVFKIKLLEFYRGQGLSL